jgi:ketosteroid isomerase-like protein
MPQENVEILRRAISATRSGPPEETVDVAVALTDPEIVFESRLVSVEGATYRGHDGVRRYFADMADAFREWRNEVDEIADVAPNAVVMDITFRATARSGVQVELSSSVVSVFAGGAVTEIHAYATRQEALEAAGLAE